MLTVDENLHRVGTRRRQNNLLQRHHQRQDQGFARTTVVGVGGDREIGAYIPDLFAVGVDHHNFQGVFGIHLGGVDFE